MRAPSSSCARFYSTITFFPAPSLFSVRSVVRFMHIQIYPFLIVLVAAFHLRNCWLIRRAQFFCRAAFSPFIKQSFS